MQNRGTWMVLTSEWSSLEEKKMAFVIDSLYKEIYVTVKKTQSKTLWTHRNTNILHIEFSFNGFFLSFLSAVCRKLISISYMRTNLTLMQYQDQAVVLKATVLVKQPLAVEAVSHTNNLGTVRVLLKVWHHPSPLNNPHENYTSPAL